MFLKTRFATKSFCIFSSISALSFLFFTPDAVAQQAITLNDLSYFKTTGKTWTTGSGVTADLTKANVLSVTEGAGILANLPGTGGADLFTITEFGDVDLELEYMMARGSNSGIYLQGRYELQLMDTRGNTNPTPADNGGIYQRWDESRPAGQFGYEGYAPRQNASKAPGLWQRLRISFQAPRFDAEGKKIANARFIRVELNDVLIHEDVEVSGPTRGAVENNEKPTGPLRFQGDHGPVAFRNIKITPFDKQRPQFSNIRYAVYRGRFYDTLDLKKLPPEAQGPLENFSATSIQNVPAQFFIKYTGSVVVREPGDYSFNLAVPGGRGIMRINNQLVTPQENRQRGGGVNLPAGEFPFELLYAKNQDWSNRAMGVSVAGPGIREYVLGDVISGGQGDAADPITVDAPVNTVLRSFMDLPGGTRVVHAVSVGSPAKVHYTYDMDKGAIVQVWRGGFLDATPMWYSRGDGSSRPIGAVQRFGKPAFTIARLSAANAQWVTDSMVTDFIPKGYQLDKTDAPTFRYMLGGTMIEDAIRVLNNGEGLSREITLQNTAGTYYARIAEGSTVEDTGGGLYVIDGRSYYLRIDDAGGSKPVLQDDNGRKVLIVPVQQKLRYSIIF